MFRSLWCKLGKRRSTAIIINGDSSSSSTLLSPTAKYFLFKLQNQNLVISNSRVTSISSSFSTAGDSDVTCSGSDSSFVVSYLINSCRLSETQAIAASGKLNFKTTTKPDSVIALFKAYGFTESHISKLINRDPSILSLKPDKTLKPKLDFFKSKGLSEHDLASFISRFPRLLTRTLKIEIIPSFDTLRSLVHSDENVIKMIKRNSWVIGIDQAKRVMVNVEILRSEGVPEANISKHLSSQPRVYTVNRFRENLVKVKEMGFDHLQTTFLIGLQVLSSMTEENWRKKMDVYNRWGWTEDQIHTAFRKCPICMGASEKKIMGIMNFLVNEMGYDSSIIAADPVVFNYSLKDRIIPRFSVIKILITKGLIEEMIAISAVSTKVDENFVKDYLEKYEPEVPELMKVFKGQLNYQDLLLS